MPVARSGVLDRSGQIWCHLGLLFIVLLLGRFELGALERTAASFNKAVACGRCSLLQSQATPKLPLAGHGGEGREWTGELTSASFWYGHDLDAAEGTKRFPLAGLGGEGREGFEVPFCASDVCVGVLSLAADVGQLHLLGWRGASREKELVSAAADGSSASVRSCFLMNTTWWPLTAAMILGQQGGLFKFNLRCGGPKSTDLCWRCTSPTSQVASSPVMEEKAGDMICSIPSVEEEEGQDLIAFLAFVLGSSL